MKTRNFALIAILVALSIVVVSTSAVVVINSHTHVDTNNNRAGSDSPRLSIDAETKIKQDYLDFYTKIRHPDATKDDVMTLSYYGTYKDCVVVKMTDAFTGYVQVITFQTIGGVTISYPDSNTAIAWKNGIFYSLQDAYDTGLLTVDDLIQIAT